MVTHSQTNDVHFKCIISVVTTICKSLTLYTRDFMWTQYNKNILQLAEPAWSDEYFDVISRKMDPVVLEITLRIHINAYDFKLWQYRYVTI